MKRLFGAVAATIAMTVGAHAATFDGDIGVAGGGTPQNYDIGGGEYLGLIDFRNAEVDDIINLGIIQSYVTSGNVTGLFAGANTNAFNDDGYEFDAISGDITVANLDRTSDGKIFDALWISYDASSSVVFRGTSTLGNTLTLAGNPLAPVPVPAALPLLLVGVGGLAFAGRRKRMAA